MTLNFSKKLKKKVFGLYNSYDLIAQLTILDTGDRQELETHNSAKKFFNY